MLLKKKETPKRSEGQATPPPLTSSNVKSPRRPPATAETKKAKLTPLKPLDESQDDISSDKEEFLMLEIKQLKRQNNFLKKKIIDLTAEFGPEKPRTRKGREKQKQKGSLQNLESMPLSVNLFFEEIHNLLNTIVKLFRINFTPEEIAAYEEKENAEMQETCPIRKHALLKKYFMKRKLERILLENEEKRFPLILDLFTQYYEFKEESDRKIIATIDTMTSKAHELNQWIIEKAQERKKSRTTFSTMVRDDGIIPIEPLRLPTSPKNLVSNPKNFAYSPAAPRNPKKMTKFAMSPAQRMKKAQ